MPFDALVRTEWAEWTAQPIPGDASARQYVRLVAANGQSVVAMQTPQAEAGSQDAFVRMARYLTRSGLVAPEILFQDGTLLVISDLGRIDMARHLRDQPRESEMLYHSATDLLLTLHDLSPPDLARLTPKLAGDMVRLTATAYCNDPAGADPMARAMSDAMARFAATPDRLALRDFHAENLIWRPELQGNARFGLLDFQDAFIAPAGYDLVSLLRDARRDVPSALHATMIARFSAAAGLDAEPFAAQLACLGVQRNLRILGVFARLARERGKKRYLAMLPRIWAHLQADLAHPALGDLRTVLTPMLPEPDVAQLRWAP